MMPVARFAPKSRGRTSVICDPAREQVIGKRVIALKSCRRPVSSGISRNAAIIGLSSAEAAPFGRLPGGRSGRGEELFRRAATVAANPHESDSRLSGASETAAFPMTESNAWKSASPWNRKTRRAHRSPCAQIVAIAVRASPRPPPAAMKSAKENTSRLDVRSLRFRMLTSLDPAELLTETRNGFLEKGLHLSGGYPDESALYCVPRVGGPPQLTGGCLF